MVKLEWPDVERKNLLIPKNMNRYNIQYKQNVTLCHQTFYGCRVF